MKFLEKFEYNELCYKLTKDYNTKFNLAIKLDYLENSLNIAETLGSKEKLKITGDLALSKGHFGLAELAFQKAKDYSSLLLLYSSSANREKLQWLAEEAMQENLFNIAFSSYYQLYDLENCYSTLVKSNQISEAALFGQNITSKDVPAKQIT